jgi:hypothetical protein
LDSGNPGVEYRMRYIVGPMPIMLKRAQ